MPRTRLLAALVALAAGGAGAPSEAGATTITVNAFEDVFADDGRCTLAEAVSAANTNLASGFAAGECAAGSALDVVSVPIGTFDISRELLVKTGVTVAGAGPLLTFVRQHVERRVLKAKRVTGLAKAKGALVVAKALGGARLRKGTVLTVTVTKAGYVGRVTTATMRDRRRRPVIARRCLPPGAARPVACT